MDQEVVSYRCPSCAAGLAFDIEAQSWSCPFCGSNFSLEVIQQEEPVPEEPVAFAPQAQIEEFGEGAAAFHCPSCGGQIVTDANTAATFCPFCHSPAVLPSRLSGEQRPVQILPFKLGKDVILAELAKVCKRHPLLPRDFRQIAQQGEVTALYVPYWLLSAGVNGTLYATGRRVMTWSDSQYRYTKTDTFRVERGARMQFDKIPADASKRLEDDLMNALEPFDYSQMVDFDMGYLSGHFAESFDVDVDTASSYAQQRMRDSVKQMLREQAHGYASLQVHNVYTNFHDAHSAYVMLPVWVLMADYQGERYTFVMNGQTGKTAGKLPICKGRLRNLFLAVAGAVSALVFVGGMLI